MRKIACAVFLFAARPLLAEKDIQVSTQSYTFHASPPKIKSLDSTWKIHAYCGVYPGTSVEIRFNCSDGYTQDDMWITQSEVATCDDVMSEISKALLVKFRARDISEWKQIK